MSPPRVRRSVRRGRRRQYPWPCRLRFLGIHAAVRARATKRRPWKLHNTANSASKASSAETNGATCQQDDISHDAQNIGQELVLDKLPEDILQHIHSLVPVQDAARAACVSRGLVRSWRCYSNLKFTSKALGFYLSPGLANEESEKNKIYIVNKIDQILTNHDANGVKVQTLDLDLLSCGCGDTNASYLDRWLQIAVKPGIKELRLVLCISRKHYNFPCSVLSDEAAASSIQYLTLSACTFHPTATLGRLARLKSLFLSFVHITEEGLGHFLSKSFALEKLDIYSCSGIICLRIPCTLQQLKFLRASSCEMMQLVEINAPNLCSLYYHGPLVEISVRDSSQLKNISLACFYQPGILSYARGRLPSIAQNVESLTLRSLNENVNTPMLHSRFLHLKKLEIELVSSRDVISLVSFLDASPALDSFTLRIQLCWDGIRKHDSVFGDDDDVYQPRCKPDCCRHNRLRQVTIMGFSSAKSLVDLTIHILEITPSLERLTLDTTRSYNWRFGNCLASGESGLCKLSDGVIAEAHRAVEAVNKYIVGRVPSAVEFEVVEPCVRCNAGDLVG